MKPEETTPENTTPTDEAEIIATELENISAGEVLPSTLFYC